MITRTRRARGPTFVRSCEYEDHEQYQEGNGIGRQPCEQNFHLASSRRSRKMLAARLHRSPMDAKNSVTGGRGPRRTSPKISSHWKHKAYWLRFLVCRA